MRGESGFPRARGTPLNSPRLRIAQDRVQHDGAITFREVVMAPLLGEGGSSITSGILLAVDGAVACRSLA